MSKRDLNIIEWVDGVSIDIGVSGYRLYSDNGKPGNKDLIYDGEGDV